MNRRTFSQIGIAGVASVASFPSVGRAQAPLQKVTINYPSRSGANWLLFIAKEGGYYQKYGLDASLVFGVHPAGVAMLISGEGQMVNSSLEQLMQAASKDGSLVLTGSGLNRGMFAVMGNKDIPNLQGLKGKRIAIGQVGDAPYGYMVALLGKYKLTPRDVEWIPVGTDVNGRVAALQSGRADAAMLTSPAYFRLEEAGYKTLANLAEHEDIYASTTYLMKKSQVASDPGLPTKFLKAHAEATKRFYEDRPFAVKAFMMYDKAAQQGDTERVYDLYAKPQAYERIPYVLAAAVNSILAQQPDPNVAAQMKAFDFHKVIDNSYVDRLVKEGFFEQVFGASIKAEEQRKSKLAFR
jgi:ABC-type nitrate/sulfonate/bicarbonate transport system substrate-binding protein